MRRRMIRVEPNRPVEPDNRFLVTARAELGEPYHQHPAPRVSVARTDPQGFEDMRLDFLAATGTILRGADKRVSGGEIAINCQRALTLDYAFDDAVAAHAQVPQ